MKKNDKLIKEIHWEKIGIYIAAMAAFMTIMFYIIEMKVDIGKLQVKVKHLQEKKC